MESNKLPEKADGKLLKEFLELQEKEIVARQSEIRVREKEVEYEKDVSLAVLASQSEAFKSSQSYQTRSAIINKVAILIFILIFLAFIIYLLETGKDVWATEFIKIVGTMIISFGGGYFYGRTRIKESDPSIEESIS